MGGAFDTLGVPVVEHYGSSEAAQISANLPPPGPFKPGTCGIPAKGAVKIVDESGREVSPGEHGEILLGGPTLTSGYLDAPELNRASFAMDGFGQAISEASTATASSPFMAARPR